MIKIKEVEELISYLECLRKEIVSVDSITLEKHCKDLSRIVNELDGVISSSSISTLEKDGYTIVREYLKEAVIKGIVDQREKANEYIVYALEILYLIKDLQLLKKTGATLITSEDLVVVDWVRGHPVYSIRRDRPNRS